MNTEALASFVKIAELRSLSAAAKLYGLPKSSLSLRIKQLEADLNVELFERAGRNLLLTEAGQTLLAHARQILHSCDAARAAVTELSDDVAGTLRIGATGEFGTAFYAQMLIAFRRLYPNVNIELTFFSPNVLYSSESLDMLDAVISWDDDETDGETLSTATFALFASQSYLERTGRPAGPADLVHHQGIVYRTPRGLQHWRLQNGAQQESILPRSNLIANDYWTIKYFAVAGEGIAYLPHFFADIECERGHLVPLLPDWASATRRVSIRVTRPHAPSRKMAAFMDVCRRYFSPGFIFAGPRYYVEAIHDPNQPEEGTRP
ncbi:LysR family transcriptional regulator [Rhizobium sp. RU36D]|uniref:LysR family transcriptional regulator n=1 Tax=Rhizobium sp. RU36D TaxID=1907415 RepID=UPI0009D84D57|nr:LysR family transcriptional regulator [Rhizobium sp. RU36D]SMC95036.1 DNA-binding transcriptional regulator, LysR family [Rhizobium sp. RU36D]